MMTLSDKFHYRPLIWSGGCQMFRHSNRFRESGLVCAILPCRNERDMSLMSLNTIDLKRDGRAGRSDVRRNVRSRPLT